MKSNACAFALLLIASSSGVWGQGDLSGDWKGTQTVRSKNVTLTAHISRARDGLYLGRMKSNLGANFNIDLIQVNGNDIRFEVKGVDGTFQGTLNAEQNRINGTWFPRALKGEWAQDGPLPLELVSGSMPPTKAPPPSKDSEPPAGASGSDGPAVEPGLGDRACAFLRRRQQDPPGL
jgi:hypothetical protein